MITAAIILFAIALFTAGSSVMLCMGVICLKRHFHELSEKDQKELAETKALENLFRYGAAGCWFSCVFVLAALVCLAIKYFAV